MNIYLSLTNKDEPKDMRKAADADVVILLNDPGFATVWKDRYGVVTLTEDD